MNAYTNKTDRALDRAWGRAIKTLQPRDRQARLGELRSAFEASTFGDTVDLHLTATTAERLADLYPDDENPIGGVFLGQTRIVFLGVEEAEEAADRLEESAEDAVAFALSGVMTALTKSQEDFIERQVRRSVQRGARAIRRAAQQVRDRAAA